MVCYTGRVFNSNEQIRSYFLRIILAHLLFIRSDLNFLPRLKLSSLFYSLLCCPSVFCCNVFNNLFCYQSLYILQLFIRHLSLPIITVYGMRSMITTKLALSWLRSGTLYGADCGGSVAWWGYCSILGMEVKE